jgi:uncharacterized lipoprotein YddW (UPF0748 family)
MNSRSFQYYLIIATLAACRSGPQQTAPALPEESLPAMTDQEPEAAAPGPQSGPPPQVGEELRGVWVGRYDWSQPGELEKILERLEEIGSNAVFFQVRGTADAYYRSSREPWAARLSGRLGKDPGFDPLEQVVEKARRRGMSVYAWFNACTAWRAADPAPGPSAPEHALRAHPHWLVRNRSGQPFVDGHGYLYFDPAHPGFRRHLLTVVQELVEKYPLDGIHFDYLRYPAAGLPLFGETARLFRRARREQPELDPDRWRRQQLVELLLQLHRLAHRLRPSIDVSAAVTGIYTNRWGWKNVVRGLDDFQQDSHRFAEMGAVDTLIPMLYWPPTEPEGGRADFVTLARDFSPLASKVRLLAGISLQYATPQDLRRQMQLAREQGFRGAVLFSFGLLSGKPVAELKRIWTE